jgi:hypothetical protein
LGRQGPSEPVSQALQANFLAKQSQALERSPRNSEVVPMNDIEGKRVAMLAADGFERSELMVPKERLEQAGAKVDIISLKTGEIGGWNRDDWGDAIFVDRTIDAVQVDEYDALIIPGG